MFSQKTCIIDHSQGSKYAYSEKLIEIDVLKIAQIPQKNISTEILSNVERLRHMNFSISFALFFKAAIL